LVVEEGSSAAAAEAAPATTVEPADLFSRLSLSWASVVRWLEAADRPHIASLVRTACLLRPVNESSVRLALHEDRAQTVTGAELALVREALQEHGFEVEVSVLTMDEVEPSELSDAFQLSQAERERREQRRRELETFVQTHDATAIILKSLPGSSIRRLLILEEELTENIDEQA
jgi:hypothetical protein